MSDEIWDLYDAQGRRTGETMRRGEAIPAGLYHLGVHIWPINSKGEFLIQRRAQSVRWKPGRWSATGGCAVAGEDDLSAAIRELREELGYEAGRNELRHIATLKRVNSFCSLFALFTNRPTQAFSLQAEEVSAIAWRSRRQLEEMLSAGMLHHYGSAYFRLLFDFQQSNASFCFGGL